MTTIIRIIVVAFILQIAGICSSAIGASVSKADRIDVFFNGNEGTRPAYYRIDSRPFSENDAGAKLAFLKKQGFNWMESAQDGGVVSYSNLEKKQWLEYSPIKSRYIL